MKFRRRPNDPNGQSLVNCFMLFALCNPCLRIFCCCIHCLSAHLFSHKPNGDSHSGRRTTACVHPGDKTFILDSKSIYGLICEKPKQIQESQVGFINLDPKKWLANIAHKESPQNNDPESRQEVTQPLCLDLSQAPEC